MPRSDEAEWWFNAVYDAVQQIPPATVTSYGHIASLLGQRELLSSSPRVTTRALLSSEYVLCITAQRARQVGVCLKHLPTDPAQFYNNHNVPWQRVVNAKGMISHR